MRLIDVDEIKLPRGFFEKVDNVPKFYEWLGTLPTVDVEPRRHGHWIYKETDYPVMDAFYECSECGYSVGFEINNYCPYCGAQMDERRKEDD